MRWAWPMIAGQRWSAATSSARTARSSDFAALPSAMVASVAPAEREAACRQRGDGDEEVGGLRRIGAAGWLRFAVGGEEAGIAVLPAGELPVEEGTAGGAILEPRQMAVEAGEEAAGAPRRAGHAAAAGAGVRLPARYDVCGHLFSSCSRHCVSGGYIRFVVELSTTKCGQRSGSDRCATAGAG